MERRLRRWAPRRVAALAALAILAGVLVTAAGPADRADAFLNTPIPSHEDGTPDWSFTEDEALFVYVISDLNGGRVCVVPDTPGATCESPAPGTTPNRLFGIGTVFSLIEAPPLPVGTWQLRSEMKDPSDPDKWVLSRMGETFTVASCGTSCNFTLGQAAAQAFKDNADQTGKGMDKTCKSVKLYQFADNVKSVIETTISFGVVGAVIAGGIAGFNIPTSTNAVAFALLEKLSCNAAGMFEDLAADPPDPNFTVIDPPQFSPTPPLRTAAETEVARGLARQDAYGRAFLHAWERYQGAEAANNTEWMHRQAQAMAEYGAALVTEMTRTADVMHDWADTLPTDRAAISSATLAEVAPHHQRIATNGFSPAEIQNLTNLGLGPSDIAELRTRFETDLSDVPVDQPLSQVMHTAADDLAAHIDGVADYARLARGVANQTDQPPTADFTVEQLGNRVVKLANTGASPDSDPLTFTWDLGDGTTATGPELQHTYATSGTYQVTLTVQEPVVSATKTTPVTVTVPVTVAEDDNAQTAWNTPTTIYPLMNDSAPQGSTLAIGPYDTTGSAGGTLACTTAGSCTYTPSPGFVGDDTFDYTATAGGSDDSAVITVTVAAPVPKAVIDSATTTTDTPVDIDVLANDTAPPGDTISVSTTGTPSAAAGTVTCTPTGPCTYTPPTGFTGVDQFGYQIATALGNATAWGTVSVSVHPPAVPVPTATADDAIVVGDAAVDIDVLANDVAPPGDSISVTTTSTVSAAGVNVTCQAAGPCTYTRQPGFAGTDQFVYGIKTATGGVEAAAIVTVTVQPPPPPDAVDDAASTPAATPVDIDVLANDVSPDAQPLVFDSFETETPHGGEVSCQATCSYSPPDLWAGTDTFHYRVRHPSGAIDDGTVTVTVEHTAPTAFDDNVAVQIIAAFDPLANDDDPDGDPLVLAGHTEPEHGTLDCDPLGGCTYVPDDGYTGPDSFTYDLADAGGPVTGTVFFDVQAPQPPASPPDVVDDLLDVRGTTPGQIDVLANDSDPNGDPITVTLDEPATHGSAACDPDGTCTYTAAAGYVGYDTFTYVADDGTGSTATATVSVRVAPADLDLVAVAGGRPESGGAAVVAGDDVAWTVGGRPSVAGLPAEFAGALVGSSIDASLSGPQTLGSVTTAPGWTYDPGTKRFTAGPDALLGDAVVDRFPVSRPPVSQGSGGDGHVPILVGNRVYAFFHHSWPTSVTCIDRTTGARCPGYPHVIPFGAGQYNGPAAVFGSKLWVHVEHSMGYPASAPLTLFCWDTATDATCGTRVLERAVQKTNVVASAPVRVGDHAYIASSSGKLFCIVGATGDPCATPSVTTGLGDHRASADIMDLVTHGTRVFASDRTGVACLDVAAGPVPCPGWPTPKNLGTSPNLVNRHDASGTTTGVCTVGPQLRCVDDANPATISSFTGTGAWDAGSYMLTEEAEAGPRTLYADATFGGGMRCWDWATMASCTGGNWTNGASTKDVIGLDLPSAYGTAFDGTCAVGIGDPGLMFTMDVNGTSPCTNLRSGSARSVDLRDQRCDGTVGTATWKRIELGDMDLNRGASFSSVLVTVRDATSGATLLTRELIGTDGTIDLSAIDAAAHPSLSVDAVAAPVADAAAWDDGKVPRLVLRWNADPAAGCLPTTTAASCTLTPNPTPLGVTATSSSGGAAATASLPMGPTPCAPTADPITRQVPDNIGTEITLVGSDANGDPITFALVGAPAHGTLSPITGGKVTYTPAPGYLGPDSFTYRSSDGTLESPPATVSLTVVHVNQAPKAVADTATTKADTSVSIAVLANDSDPEGQALTASIATQPGHGTAVVQGGTTVLYTPSTGYLGLDSFQYTAQDTEGGTATATVSLSVGPTGAAFHAVTPFRILDSRTPTGGFGGPVGPGQAKKLQVAGVNGIPSYASAVVMNVTATGGTKASYVQLYPTGAPQPLTANVLFGPGDTVPNLATVGLGPDGSIQVFNQRGSVDVVADVVGWYDDGSGPDLFHAMAPTRLLDSRTTTGGWNNTPLGSDQSRDLQVRGPGGVPNGAVAVILNVTATGGTAASYVQAYPSGIPRPTTANLLFAPGQTVPNLVTVAVGANGKVALYNQRGSVHLTADVVGWFGPGADGRWFHPITPTRLLDSRTGVGGWPGPIGADTSLAVPVTGTGVVPPDAVGFVASMTATQSDAASYLQMYPAGIDRPQTANVLFGKFQTIANMAVSATGTGGQVMVYNQRGHAHVVVDAAGYYANK